MNPYGATTARRSTKRRIQGTAAGGAQEEAEEEGINERLSTLCPSVSRTDIAVMTAAGTRNEQQRVVSVVVVGGGAAA